MAKPHRTRRTVLVALGTIALAAAIVPVMVAGPAGATTYNVTSTADAGPNTLRDAVTAAAANPGPDDVVIQPGLGTITLTSIITYGAAADGAVTIRGNGATVVFNMGGNALNNQSPSAMTIDGLTVTRSPNGGDLVNTSSGPLTVLNSTISGGGVNTNDGPLTIRNSTVTGDTGDGVNSGPGTVMLVGTTVTGHAGGGVSSSSGALTIVNSTITGNGQEGINSGSGPVSLVYSTVTGNTGANINATPFQSFASVVAQPTGGPNCSANGTSNGWNFADDLSCGFTNTGRGDNQAVGNNPGLGALASNGGPTQTRMPQPGSPLINAIPGANCQDFGAAGVTSDQRGVSRPQGPGCDIGAVERRVCPPATQASVGIGALAGAEGVVAVAPVGIYALFRRRRRGTPSPGSRRERVRSVVTWLMVAGVAVAVLAACQPVKKTPPLC